MSCGGSLFLSISPGAHKCLHPPSLSAGLRFDFNHDCTPSIILLHFSFALGHGVLFFGGFQHSLSMVIRQLIVILVFLQEKMSASPSVPPS